jgi:DNA-binding transcriptional ArsR family regulator
MESIQPSLAEVAALVGNPARANMLTALLDGRALTATELAFAGGVAPQTASGHLAKLTEGRLLTLAKQGRHAYYRLASPMIGRMLESIMAVAADGPPRYQPRWRGGDALRNARTCYDHLAGRLGVGLADALVECEHVALTEEWGHRDGGRRGILTRLRHRAARGGWNAAGILPAVSRLERAPHASRRRPGRRARSSLFRVRMDQPDT